MDIKKVGDLAGKTASQIGATSPTTSSPNRPAGSVGPSFEETLAKLQQPGALPKAAIPQGANALSGASKSSNPIKFSNHAVERMRTRGVNFTPNDLERLSQAVEKAAAKGSKDSLVLMNDNALIVSVKNNTVVTVVDKNSLKENVFTNIDSTVVI